MKKKLLLLSTAICLLFSSFSSKVSFAQNIKFTEISNLSNTKTINQAYTTIDLEKFFNGTGGCAVFYSVKNDSYEIYNPEIINTREVPCSTFKMISSLAGLKYEILKDENTTLKWDGSKQMIQDWEQDLNLKSAFQMSANWYFDEVDKKVGSANMNKILKELNYGNMDTSGGNPLGESSLKISPMEQLDFIKKLFNDQLPFQKEHMQIVRNIMLVSEEKGKLYGKTGTSGNFLEDGAQTAWFVGSYETNNDTFYFALRIYGDKDQTNITGPDARKIAENICKEVYYKK